MPAIASAQQMKRGDELRSGVLQMVKVYIATKRVISVGDKMAGRHGNKGVIAKILPVEDMPFLPDGTPIEIMLNPLGRSQSYERRTDPRNAPGLGRRSSSASRQSRRCFDGAEIGRGQINGVPWTKGAGLPRARKGPSLHDGRTGEPLEQETSPSATSTCSSCTTWSTTRCTPAARAPTRSSRNSRLGGKARFGGQRFGEMEVWALEAYGAAYMLAGTC